ncbi:MAG: hypothetical protein ACI8Y4_003573, partial [Candidatus Poriferisodalaceae bacterium]
GERWRQGENRVPSDEATRHRLDRDLVPAGVDLCRHFTQTDRVGRQPGGNRSRESFSAAMESTRRYVDWVAIDALHSGSGLEYGIAFDVLTERNQTQFIDQRVHERFVRPEPGRSEIETGRPRQKSSSDPIARFEHDYGSTLFAE